MDASHCLLDDEDELYALFSLQNLKTAFLKGNLVEFNVEFLVDHEVTVDDKTFFPT